MLAARRASLERSAQAARSRSRSPTCSASPSPTRSGAVRAAHPDLAADTLTDDVVTVAGRVVLKRDMGKLVFATLRDRDGDLQLVLNARELARRRASPCSRRSTSATSSGRPARVGTTRKGELSVFVTRWAMLTKALRPLPEKWAGLQDPDLQQRRRYLHLITDEEPRARVPRARRRAQDDPAGARRAWVRRVRRSDAADDRGRRERPAVHDAPPRARHPDEAPDQPGAVPEADARRRRRAGLRARPQLPQRGHRPRPQPRVHDARGLPGLRRLPHDDGALRDAGARMPPAR